MLERLARATSLRAGVVTRAKIVLLSGAEKAPCRSSAGSGSRGRR